MTKNLIDCPRCNGFGDRALECESCTIETNCNYDESVCPYVELTTIQCGLCNGRGCLTNAPKSDLEALQSDLNPLHEANITPCKDCDNLGSLKQYSCPTCNGLGESEK